MPWKPGWQPEQSSYTPHALALGAERARAARVIIESAVRFFIVFPFASLVVVPTRECVCRCIDGSFMLAQITLLGSAGGL
jgi:hypothetical protein